MDAERFDHLTMTLGGRKRRRQVLGGLAGSVLAACGLGPKVAVAREGRPAGSELAAMGRRQFSPAERTCRPNREIRINY